MCPGLRETDTATSTNVQAHDSNTIQSMCTETESSALSPHSSLLPVTSSAFEAPNASYTVPPNLSLFPSSQGTVQPSQGTTLRTTAILASQSDLVSSLAGSDAVRSYVSGNLLPTTMPNPTVQSTGEISYAGDSQTSQGLYSESIVSSAYLTASLSASPLHSPGGCICASS